MTYKTMLAQLRNRVGPAGTIKNIGVDRSGVSFVTAEFRDRTLKSGHEHRVFMHDGERMVDGVLECFHRPWEQIQPIVASYFKLFNDIPPTISSSLIDDYSILHRLDSTSFPRDKDLLKKMSTKPIMVGALKFEAYVSFEVHNEAERQSAGEFYAKYSRFPMNKAEAERGRPFDVRIAKFGVTLPYFTPIQLNGPGSNYLVIRDTGVGERGSPIIFYPMKLAFDPDTQEFNTVLFSGVPYVNATDGLDRFKARISAGSVVTTIADTIETLTLQPLSLKAFTTLGTLVKNTCRPDGDTLVTYEPEWGGLKIETPESRFKGLPLLESPTEMEGYLLVQNTLPSLREAKLYCRNAAKRNVAHQETLQR